LCQTNQVSCVKCRCSTICSSCPSCNECISCYVTTTTTNVVQGPTIFSSNNNANTINLQGISSIATNNVLPNTTVS